MDVIEEQAIRLIDIISTQLSIKCDTLHGSGIVTVDVKLIVSDAHELLELIGLLWIQECNNDKPDTVVDSLALESMSRTEELISQLNSIIKWEEMTPSADEVKRSKLLLNTIEAMHRTMAIAYELQLIFRF